MEITKKTFTPEELRAFLEGHFPRNATCWSQATQEVMDLCRHARELAGAIVQAKRSGDIFFAMQTRAQPADNACVYRTPTFRKPFSHFPS